MCKRLNFGCILIEFDSEIFYVISKKSEFISAFKEKENLIYADKKSSKR